MEIKKYLPVIILIALTFFSVRFLFNPGFYTFSDESHLANLYEMTRALREWQIPPRWAPDFSYNFGYPFFNFNYVLPYYIGSIPFIFGVDLVNSLKIVFILSMLFSAVSFYLLTSHLFSRITALSLSLIYIYTPYRALNLYARGAIGEMWAFVFLPLLILGVLRLKAKINIGNISLISFALVGLILSHNLTALIFGPFLAALIIFLSWQNGKLFLSYSVAILIGFLVSSFYSVPAILELSNVKPGTPYNPIDHFPTISQLIIPFWGYGASVPGPGDGLSFQIGIINIIAIILGIFSFIFIFKKLDKIKKVLYFWLIFIIAISLILMNFRSAPLWQSLSILSYIQFPWRLLTLITLSSTLLLGFLEKTSFKFSKIVILCLSITAIFLTWNYFQPAKQVNFSEDDYLKRFFINRERDGYRSEQAPLYYQISEDYIPLLKWTKVRPSKLPAKIEVPADIKANTKELKSTLFEIGYEATRSFELTFNSYFYPGWEASLDSEEIPIKIGEPFGQMVFELPEGQHNLQIAFKETKMRMFVDVISVTTFLIVSLLNIQKIWKKRLP